MKCLLCFGKRYYRGSVCPICNGSGTSNLSSSEESNERYTPLLYIEEVRRVFGGVINLDAASCEVANHRVKAREFYTKENSGLTHRWKDKTFCNPPFGRLNYIQSGVTFQRLFLHKGIREYLSGNSNEIIFLLLGSALFNEYARVAFQYAICFVTSKVYFTDLNGEDRHSGYGTAFIHVGNNHDRFRSIFTKYGPIHVPSPDDIFDWHDDID